jgi:hypothetical protein
MVEPAISPVTPPAPETRATLVGKCLLVVWMLAYSAGAVFLLFDLWLSPRHAVCLAFRIADCSKFPGDVIAALHAILGGVIGAASLDMVSFHKYVSQKNVFDMSHGWGYLFAPLLGGILGLVTFALLQSGMLVFSGSTPTTGVTFVSRLSYLATGFLAGFGWLQATQGINRLVNRLFSSESAEPRPKEPPAPVAPEAAEEVTAPAQGAPVQVSATVTPIKP